MCVPEGNNWARVVRIDCVIRRVSPKVPVPCGQNETFEKSCFEPSDATAIKRTKTCSFAHPLGVPFLGPCPSDDILDGNLLSFRIFHVIDIDYGMQCIGCTPVHVNPTAI